MGWYRPMCVRPAPNSAGNLPVVILDNILRRPLALESAVTFIAINIEDGGQVGSPGHGAVPRFFELCGRSWPDKSHSARLTSYPRGLGGIRTEARRSHQEPKA